MNKTDLIDQLAKLLDGNKKSAHTAVESIIDAIQREVQKGQNVSIAGFGVFEKRQRAARTARNPRTGEQVKVKKTAVPVFRPGKYFKDVIAGTVKLPKPTGKPMTARAAAAAANSAAKAAAARTTTRAPRTAAAAKTVGTTAPRTRAAAKTATTARPTRVRSTETKTTATATITEAPTNGVPGAAALKAEVPASAVKKPAARRARATAE